MNNMYDILGKLRLMESRTSDKSAKKPEQVDELSPATYTSAAQKARGQGTAYAAKATTQAGAAMYGSQQGKHEPNSPAAKMHAFAQKRFDQAGKFEKKAGLKPGGAGIHLYDPTPGDKKYSKSGPQSLTMAEAKPEQQRMFGASMEELLKKYRRDVDRFRSSGELNDRLYSALYDYFVNGDEMPYGVAKARTGDPMQWISNRLAQHLGMNEADIDEVSRGEYIKQQDTKAERSGKKKFKAFGQEFSTDEVKENDAMMSDADRGEYDYEGDMAKDQLRTIEAAAEELKSILSDEENLPEWVQKKITLAAEYVDTARDYMLAKHDEQGEQPLGEKAVSQAQQQAAGIALAAKKKGKTPPGKGAAAAMAKMSKKELEKFAGTKHEGLPKKKKTKEEVEETTVAGSVAPAPSDTGKKKKGGVQFGKGIYENQLRESFDNRLKAVLNEGVSFSVNVDANGAKTLNVNATDEDAERLAQILQLAGMPQAENYHEACPACGSEPCGCEAVSEGDYGNSPETVTSSSDMMVNGLAGGLNGPKQQSNPNNPGDNPLAMPRLGQHSSPNLNLGIQKDEKEINEEIELGLRELYKRYKP